MKHKIWRKVCALVITLVVPTIIGANEPLQQLDQGIHSPELSHHRCDFATVSCKSIDNPALNLWILNTEYLKDGFDLVVFRSHGNEILLVIQQIVENSLNINRFYDKRPNNDDIQHIMVKQFFVLDAYILALKLDLDVSQIDLRLLASNQELTSAFKRALHLDKKQTANVRRALSERLVSLKQLGAAYVEAFFSGEFKNVYRKYNRALVAAINLATILNQSINKGLTNSKDS